MNRPLKILTYLTPAVLATLAGLYVGAIRMQPEAVAAPAVSALYSQTLPDAKGTPYPLAAYKGKIVVVNFWATWCGPCVEEIPEFSKLQAEYSGKGVQFVGIGIDTASKIAEFDAKIHAGYPLLVAGNTGSDLVRQMGDGAGGLPYTLVLDQDGKVRATKMGRLKGDELRRLLKPMIKG